MSGGLREVLVAALVLGTTSCQLGWKEEAGPQTLGEAPAPGEAPSREVACEVPQGWCWYRRGRDLITTRDGVFLQNILVERIHVEQTEQSIAGFFPVAALTAKQWPVRTVKHLQAPLGQGLSPAEAARAILGSRANDAALADLEAGAVSTQLTAGQTGFRVALQFRLVPRGPSDLEWPFYAWSEYSVQGRRPPYRSICCGFVLDDWLYCITYTAARRHYFDQDLATFEAFLRSFRLGRATRSGSP